MIGGRDQSRRSVKSAERRPREFSPNVPEGVEVGIGSIPPDLTHESQFLERTTQCSDSTTPSGPCLVV